ncbi:MAG TPA: hypothetical protein VKO45_05850, partial [Methanomicrobiales archaeon]|nr:hypothetical protein [Methanomicrobiales archaeon]
GKNFELGKEWKVRLLGKGATIQCTDIMSNDTTITCKFTIPKKPEESPAGTWSVIVTNADLAEDRLDDAFTVNEA